MFFCPILLRAPHSHGLHFVIVKEQIRIAAELVAPKKSGGGKLGKRGQSARRFLLFVRDIFPRDPDGLHATPHPFMNVPPSGPCPCNTHAPSLVSQTTGWRPISVSFRVISEIARHSGKCRPPRRHKAIAPVTEKAERPTPSVEPPCNLPGQVGTMIHHAKNRRGSPPLLSRGFNQVNRPHWPIGT